jgi:hypothetical protein
MVEFCGLIWFALVGFFRPRVALEAEISVLLRAPLAVTRIDKSASRRSEASILPVVGVAIFRTRASVNALRMISRQGDCHEFCIQSICGNFHAACKHLIVPRPRRGRAEDAESSGWP